MRARVHVRHRGRATTAQSRALDSLLPRYLLRLPRSPGDEDAAAAIRHLDEAFGRRAPLAVEIGFGNGNALVALALAHPDWNCIGVDVYRPGFGALMLACERDDVRNVRIVDDEGLAFLRRLPEASVRHFSVFFPDPWPKKRHHKRRLVNASFASRVAACLTPNGHILLATDWPEYAQAMREALDAVPTLRGGIAPRPDIRPTTPFEAKALTAGRPIVDLAYRTQP